MKSIFVLSILLAGCAAPPVPVTVSSVSPSDLNCVKDCKPSVPKNEIYQETHHRLACPTGSDMYYAEAFGHMYNPWAQLDEKEKKQSLLQQAKDGAIMVPVCLSDATIQEAAQTQSEYEKIRNSR